MLTCTLGDKTYTVPKVTGRVLREIDPALAMYAKIVRAASSAEDGKEPEETFSVKEALDVMIDWFCILFGNQFTPDEVLDHYESDQLMHDLIFAIMAVNSQTTQVLSDFPMTAAQTETTT